MLGLFVRRHAEAIEQCGQDVTVIYVQASEIKGKEKWEIETLVENYLTEIKVYFRKPTCRIKILRQFLTVWRSFHAYRAAWQINKQANGKPDLVHVNVLTRNGVVALCIKWLYKIPFIITEHWSRYLPESYRFHGYLRKWFTRCVVRNAFCVTTVTENLAYAMKNCGLENKNYKVVPNVVHPAFFQVELKKQKIKPFRFVHISCFEDISKNISGMLKAVKNLSQKREDFVFQFIGDGVDFIALKQLAEYLQIPEKNIEFSGLLEGQEIIDALSQADCLVQFSNYENFPVVLAESLACGVPVISTRVGGIDEFIDSSCGVLIEKNNISQLQQVMEKCIDGEILFDSEHLRKKAINLFSYEVVGNQFLDIYRKVIKERKEEL